MILTTEEKETIFNNFKEDIVNFFEEGKYRDDFLKTNVIAKNIEEGFFLKFSILNKLYKEYPHFLLFLNDFELVETLSSYIVFTGANTEEVVNFSKEKALEFGIEEEYINKRLEFINQLAFL